MCQGQGQGFKNKEGKEEPRKRGKKEMNNRGKGRTMEEREERDEH